MLKRNSAFACLLASAFLALGLIGILSHEMWRDELEIWMISRESASLADLFYYLRYDGHPGLWPLALYLVSRFTRAPAAMQLLHLLFAATTVYLFARFSPFTKGQKILFSFGYFPFYEYALICRNYALGVLLLFAFCALFWRRRTGYLLLSFILALLANTSVYGTMIAIALGLTLVFECFVDNERTRTALASKWDLSLSLCVFGLGVLGAVYQMKQPPDSGSKVIWEASLRIKWLLLTLTAPWKSYVPIPNFFTYQFWNTNILMQGPMAVPAVVCAALGLALLALSVALLARTPVALFLYLCGTVGILLFTYVFRHIRFLGSLRHHGHFFMVFIASLWIARQVGESELSSRFLGRFKDTVPRFGNAFLTALLCAHLAAGMIAFGFDLFNPFSASKEAAKFIKDQGLADTLIVGTRDFAVSPLAALLDRKIYYLDSDRFASFVVWDNKRAKVSPYDIPGKLSTLLTERNPDILLVVNYDLAPLFVTSQGRARIQEANLSISSLAAYTRTIYPDEQYLLYLVRRQY